MPGSEIVCITLGCKAEWRPGMILDGGDPCFHWHGIGWRMRTVARQERHEADTGR